MEVRAARERTGRVTEGVHLDLVQGAPESCAVVIDIEGTDGLERQHNVGMEGHHALFATLISDVILFNLDQQAVELVRGGGWELLRYLFQVSTAT